MRHTQRWIWIGLLAALITLVACGSAAEENNSGEAGTIPDEISCQAFYRPSAGAPFNEATLTPSTAAGQGASTATAAFEDMSVDATFLSDAGEGKSLSVVVTDLTSGAELTRGLYQFDPQAGVTDQFIGGHGFTGLAYVYHPASDSEVQYFCTAGS
jgi:hypothetical protein